MTRIKAEIADLDRKIGMLMGLLVDPETDANAKKAVLRQAGELEQRREQLHGATGRLAEEAGANTEKLAAAIRQAMGEAKASLASLRSPAEFNRFVARFVGSIEVMSDGAYQQKVPSQMLSHPTGDIEGNQRCSE